MFVHLTSEILEKFLRSIGAFYGLTTPPKSTRRGYRIFHLDVSSGILQLSPEVAQSWSFGVDKSWRKKDEKLQT